MAKYTCPLCAARGKTWNGSDPTCGFHRDGSFNGENWNCATLNELRGIVEEHTQWLDSVQQHAANLDIGEVELPNDGIGFALWLTWYKSRGKTDAAYIMHDLNAPRPLTEADALAILHHYGRANVKVAEGGVVRAPALPLPAHPDAAQREANDG